MKTLIAFLLIASSAFAQQTQPASPFGQNWKSQHAANLSRSTFTLNSGFAVPPSSTEMGFSFTFSVAQRQTSAAVYNSSGNLIRTLWNNRAYQAGTYGDIWDGLDDYGNAATGSPYTIKVAYNNVSYNWDGVMFDTDQNPQGPNSWGGATTSFPVDMTFIRGRGYVSAGYGESGNIPMSSFDEANPNGSVYPVIRYAYNLGLPSFVQTDGNMVYILMQAQGTTSTYKSGVYAFNIYGLPYSFSGGAAMPSLQWTDQTQNGSPGAWGGLMSVDGSQYLSSGGAGITGFSVQYGSGTYIATAHGQFQPQRGTPLVPSLDQVWLFSKSKGAQTATVSVTNPQEMAFDLNGNLWVISGNGTSDAIYEVTGIGSTNTVTNMTSTLGVVNPMWVKVSPTTGDVFVIDGGTHQQIYEYNPTTFAKVSTIGLLNGYNNSGTCNANIDPTGHDTPIFQFDGLSLPFAHFAGTLSQRPSASWLSIDDNGDLWIGDYPNWRILHMHWNGSSWKYVNRIMSTGWQYYTAMPTATPTRVWGGFLGLNEFSVNYSVPLQPGDPEAAGGNGSWDLVRNWAPCIIQSGLNSGQPPQMQDVQVFANGHTVGLVRDPINRMYTVTMDTNGRVAYDLVVTLGFHNYFAPDGSIYDYSSAGSGTTFTFTITNRALTGYDGNNLPTWSASTTNAASYTANHANGQPYFNTPLATAWPSSGGIIPVFDSPYNADATGNSFHLGGVAVGGSSLSWQTRKQRIMQESDGEGSFPGLNLATIATVGVLAFAMPNSHDIFAYDSVNYQNWGCQLFHYRDDGLLLGQFGFLGSAGYAPQTLVIGISGHPSNTTLSGQPLVPGFCGDSEFVHGAQIGSDYYLVVSDEAYYHGIHRWHVSNLSSIHEASASGAVGSTVSLTQLF